MNHADIEKVNAYTEKLFQEKRVPMEFPDSIKGLTTNDVKAAPCRSRWNLRGLDCFTIDCDDTKDMDDAVSIRETADGYFLGVHIADVAAYVTPFSILDEVAMQRGTSLYLPNMTVPMLPEILSNDLCSLSPNKDRNTISVLVRLTRDAKVVDYRIMKALIRSRVMGKYSEVNRIILGTANQRLMDKYAPVIDQIMEMQHLAFLLRKKREYAGAVSSTGKRANDLFENGEMKEDLTSNRIAEGIISEFMILANSLVAEYLEHHGLPAMYRTQKCRYVTAEYSTEVSRHASLEVEYLHFTSPIRRMADLKVHQVLTEYLNGASISDLQEMFWDDLASAAKTAIKRSRIAREIERDCRRYCYIISRSRYRQHVSPA